MRRSFITIGLLNLLTTALILPTTPVNAQVVAPPTLLQFQGRLTRPDGTPVANGNYSLRFSLWSALTGGTEKWNQTISTVAVKNGTFAVLLNVTSPANLFDNNNWLEIKVGTATPLTPRQQLVSVAYAQKARTVPDNSITSAKIVDGTITGADIANGTITGANIANGSITSDKISGGLAPSGAAGGDLTGTYPNPELRTSSSSLYKVSGTLMSALQGGAAGVDLAQNVVNAQNQDEAWQSFQPSQSGNLTAIALYIGTTTGLNKTIPLTVYAGEGTTGGVLGSTSITVTPAMGFQVFNLAQPIPLTAGQTYTFYVGRSASLQFGYANGNLYPNGKADIGATLDYAFRTFMNTGANGRVSVNGDFAISGQVVGRISLFGGGLASTAGSTLPLTSLYGQSLNAQGQPQNNVFLNTFLSRPVAGADWTTAPIVMQRVTDATPQATLAFHRNNIGINTTTPEMPLHLNGDMLLNNGNTLYAKNAAGNNEIFLHPRWSDNATYMNFGAGGFNLRNNDATSVMFVKPDGNVGIGTTTPGAKLDVKGSVNATGAMTIGGGLNLLNGSDLNLYGNPSGNPDDSGDLVFRNAAGGQLGRMWSQPGGGILWLSPRADSDWRAIIHNGGLSVNGSVAINDSGNSGIVFTGNGENASDTGIVHQTDGMVGFLSNGSIPMWTLNGQNYLQASQTNIYNRLNVYGGNQFYIYSLPDLGDWRNVQWNPNTGQLSQDNSTRRDKRDITPLTEKEDVMKLLQAEAKVYTRPWNRERWELGFIAEDFDDLGLKRLVWYGKDGKTPESLNYTKIVVYLTEIAKAQQKQLEAQKLKLETLEKKSVEVDALRAQMEVLMQRLEQLEQNRK